MQFIIIYDHPHTIDNSSRYIINRNTFSIKAEIIFILFFERSGEHAGEYKILVIFGWVKNAYFFKDRLSAFDLMAGRRKFYFSDFECIQ